MFTNREEFIKELTLREHIRSVAKTLLKEKWFGKNKKSIKAPQLSTADKLEKAYEIMTSPSPNFKEMNGLNYIIWGPNDEPIDPELHELGKKFTAKLKQVAAEHRKKESESPEQVQEANNEEAALRKIIKEIITEAAEEMAPHENTGINVLADLLKKIIPQIEQEYKMLTTDAEQRESFRAHVINATQNSLSTSQSMDSSDEMDMALPELEEQEEEVDINLDVEAGEDKFIDIDEKPPEEEEEEEDTFGLDNEDETGRNFAQRAFEKVEKQIVEAYALLSNEEDKQLFYDYLITNLKLYFDRFEEELASTTEEPTTDEYEAESEGTEEGDLELDTEDEEELEL